MKVPNRINAGSRRLLQSKALGQTLSFMRSNTENGSRLVGFSVALFPLTPTLSLEERENHRSPHDIPSARGTFQRCRPHSPLPEGEGQGEGERDSQSPDRFRFHQLATFIIAFLLPFTAFAADPLADQPGFVKSEFIYATAPFPECHASTIEQATAGHLVASWFGGTREKHPDVGIWVSRHDAGQWTTPVEVANGVQTDGSRHPTWNPVLFQAPNSPLLLFFKTGPSPDTWWGELIVSDDGGKTWKDRRRLPDGILGPVRNKPVLIGDVLLCGSSTEHDGWVVHMEATRDWGKTWERSGPLNAKDQFGAIQPTILNWPDGRVQLLHRSRQAVVTENWMRGDWKTWSPMTKTTLPNPNSGIDAVMLKDGRALLVYNHIGKDGNEWGGRRSPLNLAVSKDGKTWQAALVLENDNGEYSYPAIIQSADGLAHITYTWKRQRVKHVVVDPTKLVARDFANGEWPR